MTIDTAGIVELANEAICAAADAVRAGDLPDPSQAYKDKEARETKAALLAALVSLDERVKALEKAGERGCFVLAEMMKAYERRIRSDCHSQDDLDKRPWECAEYVAAVDYLRKVWGIDAALSSTGKAP